LVGGLGGCIRKGVTVVSSLKQLLISQSRKFPFPRPIFRSYATKYVSGQRKISAKMSKIEIEIGGYKTIKTFLLLSIY
jgi:hypothetical protein